MESTSVTCQACGKVHNHAQVHPPGGNAPGHKAIDDVACHHCGAVGKMSYNSQPEIAEVSSGGNGGKRGFLRGSN